MRAIWSAKQNCSQNVSQKVKHIRRLSERSPTASTGNVGDIGRNINYVKQMLMKGKKRLVNGEKKPIAEET